MADDPVSARHEPIPDSTDLLGQEHARRRKRMFAGLGAAAVLLVAGAAALVVTQDRAAKGRLATTSADLSQCLFGAAVPGGEAPSRRLRAGQLTAMGLADPERAAVDGQTWPQRCGLVAQDLMEAAKDAGLASKDDDADLVDRADALAKALKAPAAQFADLSSAVDTAWSALGKAGVAVEASTRVAGPPTPAKPLDASLLGESAAISTTSFAFSSFQVSPYAGDVIHLLVQDAAVPRSPFVCALTDGPIRCRSLPGELGKGQKRLVMMGTAAKGAWPLLVAGEQGEQGLYRSDTGAKVADTPPLGASIADDGTVRLLRQDGDSLVLDMIAPDGSKGRSQRHAIPQCVALSASVLWEQGVVECRDGRFQWTLLPLGKNVPEDDRPSELAGTATEVSPGGVRSCRAGDTVIAAFRQSILFFDGLGWTKPARSDARGGGITCGDKVSSVTYLAEAGGDTPWRNEIGHLRCTVAGCAPTGVEFERLLRGGLEGAPRLKLFDAASIGDKMIVAWASGQLGGVRMRTGAPDAIVGSNDVVVFDDLATEGELAGKPDLLELVVIGQPKHATLLLRSSRGVHAVRIAEGGGFAPAEVVWEGGAPK